ncbi:MAG: hypothetical protein ACREDO_04025 [Methyloceanibacter sp.]
MAGAGDPTLAQHHPFDYGAFVRQVLATSVTVTVLPAPILAELTEDGVLRTPQCRLKRLGCVWSVPELAEAKPPLGKSVVPFFDLYPLGDLASLVLRCEPRPSLLPLGPVHVAGDGHGAIFAETRLGDERGHGSEVFLRGPVVPHGEEASPLAADRDGYVGTGLSADAEGGSRLRLRRDLELIHHGGFTIAASELDALYQSVPGLLDAACFVLPDPIVGDRIFAAVAPSPIAPVSFETLHRLLTERGVTPYKFPDKLLVVRQIPRDATGRIMREEILMQV